MYRNMAKMYLDFHMDHASWNLFFQFEDRIAEISYLMEQKELNLQPDDVIT